MIIIDIHFVNLHGPRRDDATGPVGNWNKSHPQKMESITTLTNGFWRVRININHSHLPAALFTRTTGGGKVGDDRLAEDKFMVRIAFDDID